MTTSFPGSADTFTEPSAPSTTALSSAGDGSRTHIQHHTDLGDAVEAIEALLLAITANRQTASYTLVVGDANKVVEMNSASANNLTVPPNSSVAFPVGTMLEVGQYGAGQTTLVAGAGVTIRSAGGKLKLTSQYSTATLRKVATDEWWAAGDLSL